MSGDDGTVVTVIDKNGREEVRALLKSWQGHELFDLRVYAGDDGEERVPTKKGLCASVNLLPELRDAIDKLISASSR